FIKGWIISLVIAFSLSAIQLLPFLELVGYSTRATITREDAAFGSLPPPLLLNAIFPPDLQFPEWFLYPGIGALVLVLTGLALSWSRRERCAAIVVLGGLVLALGTSTPLFDLLYSIIPGYSVLRVPARWWLFSLFALSLLAGWGLEKWLAKVPKPNPRADALLIAFGLFYGLTAVLALIIDTAFPFEMIPSAIGVIILILIILSAPSKWKLLLITSIILMDLWWTTGGLLRPQSSSDIAAPSPITALLQDSAQKGERSFAPYGGLEMSNLAALNLRAAAGYDSFVLDAYSQFGLYASGCGYSSYSASVPPTASSPAAVQECPDFEPLIQLLAALTVRYILLPMPSQIPQAMFVLSHDGIWVYELPTGFGRAFGVTDGLVTSADECLEFLRQTDLATKVVLEEELPFEPGGRPPSVLSRQETINSETFLVDVTHPGMLVRSESWAPAWKASIDGTSVDVLRVDCAIQGVWLEPGDQKVTFTYTSIGYVIGRSISLASCAILIIGLVLLAYRLLRGVRSPKR
ncbi:MAG: hypothetical protein V3S81_07965, partial [Anaerolineales bacterium]